MTVEETFATVDENLRKIGVRFSEVVLPGVEPSFLDALETYVESPLPQGLREWYTFCGGTKNSLRARVGMLFEEILCPTSFDEIEYDMQTEGGAEPWLELPPPLPGRGIGILRGADRVINVGIDQGSEEYGKVFLTDMTRIYPVYAQPDFFGYGSFSNFLSYLCELTAVCEFRDGEVVAEEEAKESLRERFGVIRYLLPSADGTDEDLIIR
ncbi:MAG: hypothetical protein AAF514_05490 [Verrucomicrobiota bacterium]